jgi:diguanylate cyclase (GGDEF)-like protein
MGCRRILGILVPLVVVCLAARAQGPQGETPRTLTTAQQVHSLAPEKAARAYPVRLHAVVTYYDPYIDTRHGALFVHDASGDVFISVPARPILPLKAGALVAIRGVTGLGDYAPIVDGATMRVIGQSHLPPDPLQASLARMLTGAMDAQWVQVEGRVRSVHLEPGNVVLEMATDGGTLSAISTRENGADYEALVDSLVRIHGNAAPVFNQRRQMVGVHLFLPSLHEVRVIQAAPRDPFAVPVVPISQLFRYSPDPGLLHRVHVRGSVTLDWPGSMLCIEDGNDGICIQTAQATPVASGSLVDVVGFPAINQYKPTLEDATIRERGGPVWPVPPVFITADQAIRGNLDGRLVRIDAELIGQDLTSAVPTLMLRTGRFLIPVMLPKDAAADAALRWKDGSLLRMTGVCIVRVDSLSTNLGEGAVRPGSVDILLRSVDDIAVLRTPSWWTPEHTLESFGAAGMLVLAALGWIVFLRHRVRQQTQALRESEERLRHLSEHDALTGLPNRILLNDRLQIALARAARFQTCLGLLMVDVDGFKEVNDALGHQTGDNLLRELAGRLGGCVRSTDTVARIGGDEFVVLLPDLRIPVEAEMIAAKIVASASSPMAIDEAQAAITVSIGAVTDRDGSCDGRTLMEHADQAMYAAKKRGKNGFQVYSPGLAEDRGGSDSAFWGAPGATVSMGRA